MFIRRSENGIPVVTVMHVTHGTAPGVFRKMIESTQKNVPPVSVARIVIKINLCEYRAADSGATTDPILLRALIEAIRGCYGNTPISVIENDATSLDADSAFRYMGIMEVAEETNTRVINIAKDGWQSVRIPRGRLYKAVDLPALLDKDTLYVNFAKMKINSGSTITGCLKNNYGLLRCKDKAKLHHRLSDVIHDINLGLQVIGMPTLCVIDGVIAMETIGGPAFGRPKRCELAISGTDAVATDSCEARIMGFSPRRIHHVHVCGMSGIGSLRYELRSDVDGDVYRDYRFRFEGLQYWLRSRLKGRAGLGA